MKLNVKKIIDIVKKYFQNCQAIYLFGSFADGNANKNSDIDIALLLPNDQARKIKNFYMSEIRYELMEEAGRDVDLINLRCVSTVLQKEIISKGECIFCGDDHAKNEFEMLTLSFYQKLNEERKGILADLFTQASKATSKHEN